MPFWSSAQGMPPRSQALCPGRHVSLHWRWRRAVSSSGHHFRLSPDMGFLSSLVCNPLPTSRSRRLVWFHHEPHQNMPDQNVGESTFWDVARCFISSPAALSASLAPSDARPVPGASRARWRTGSRGSYAESLGNNAAFSLLFCCLLSNWLSPAAFLQSHNVLVQF